MNENPFDLMRRELDSARSIMSAADHAADNMAELLCGRLTKVNAYRLRKLKRELSRFNMKTGEWKD